MVDARRARHGPGYRHPSDDGGQSRRSRWDSDAGVTARDVAALVWLGQQYAARSDVLRVLLGRLSPGNPKVAGQLGEETLRDVLDRWQERGLVDRDRLLGHVWAAPTAKALRLVGLDVRPWWFVIPQLAHVHAVGVVRLALEPSIPEGGRWVSERELRGESARHVPDGGVELPDDPEDTSTGLYGQEVDPLARRVAVEVELTRKAAGRLRESWQRPRHGRWLRTVYYAPPEVASYLDRQLDRIQPRHPIQVRPLPEVPGVTYPRFARYGGVL
jgi:ribosomal protein S18 acetylase RimI-like enzyme